MQMKSLIVILLLLAHGCAPEEAQHSRIKLYALDCGTIEVSDMSAFSREGKFDGQKKSLVAPCFLIRHPKGDMFWDVGLDQSTLGNRSVLTDQLTEIALKPADIEYLAISHLHPDHAGNANLFAKSVFIVNEAERAYMFSDEIMNDHEDWVEKYSALENSKTIQFKEEYDVFGDDTVVIKSMPGHTPGSSILLLRLDNAGVLLFSGDLYTHAQARELRTVPVFNTDPEATLISMEKFETLALRENTRVIVEHEIADFESLPLFPKFLD